LELDYQLDTGATTTLIPRSDAEWLDLQLDVEQPEDVGVVGPDDDKKRKTVSCFRSRVRIIIPGDWIEIPCLVPESYLVRDRLLGMDGLLGDCLFCVSCDELHLFRRLGAIGAGPISSDMDSPAT
jgi:hypothetical protein